MFNDTSASTCSVCYFKQQATRWLKDASKWEVLRDLLREQNYRCVYSDELLELGRNASLDHIKPRSKGGEAVCENLQWVTWTVNRAKTDMTHDEFVTLCHAVARTNPHHLYAGTHAENMRDVHEANRGAGRKTSWEDRVLIAERLRVGEAAAEVAEAYGVTVATCRRWLEYFYPSGSEELGEVAELGAEGEAEGDPDEAWDVPELHGSPGREAPPVPVVEGRLREASAVPAEELEEGALPFDVELDAVPASDME